MSHRPQEETGRGPDSDKALSQRPGAADESRLVELSIAYDRLMDEVLRSRRWKIATTLSHVRKMFPAFFRIGVIGILQRIWRDGVGAQVTSSDRLTQSFTDLREELYAFLYPAGATPVDRVADPQQVGDATDLPRATIVSPLFLSAHAITQFLTSVYEQDYGGAIDVILVDDHATDAAPQLAMNFAASLAGSDLRSVSVIRSERNLGNCGARNLGVAAARGDVVIVVDPDCVLNSRFVRDHVAGHLRGLDIVIGPMGLECRKEDLPALLARLGRAGRAAVAAAMRMQDPRHLASPVNCVTRNFSISRRMLARLAMPLFDERFAYRQSEDTGFGWEDVEMGARLFKAGATIGFEWTAYSIHMQHPASVSAATKARGLARNFDMLLTTHPELLNWHAEWADDTMRKINARLLDTGQSYNNLARWVERAPAARPKESAVVYSAIAGVYDNFVPSTKGTAPMVLFTDVAGGVPLKAAYRPFDEVNADPVRTAKKPKVLPHLYFPDAEWSVWIDGNVTLLVDPEAIIDEVRRSACHIGGFRHPERDCMYDEAARCIQRSKDDAAVITEQVTRQREAGLPRHIGLVECNVLVRRHHHPDVREAMEAWWRAILEGSRRDQLSFNFVMWRTGLAYHELGNGALNVRTDRRFQYRPHLGQT